jgi:hypothetical protein
MDKIIRCTTTFDRSGTLAHIQLLKVGTKIIALVAQVTKIGMSITNGYGRIRTLILDFLKEKGIKGELYYIEYRQADEWFQTTEDEYYHVIEATPLSKWDPLDDAKVQALLGTAKRKLLNKTKVQAFLGIAESTPVLPLVILEN